MKSRLRQAKNFLQQFAEAPDLYRNYEVLDYLISAFPLTMQQANADKNLPASEQCALRYGGLSIPGYWLWPVYLCLLRIEEFNQKAKESEILRVSTIKEKWYHLRIYARNGTAWLDQFVTRADRRIVFCQKRYHGIDARPE